MKNYIGYTTVLYYYFTGYFDLQERGFSLHSFYTLNCFKQSARYFLISESVPGINFRLRWVRCLNGFVSITFNVQVVRSPFIEPWEIKWRMNLQGENKNKWWMSSNICKSLKSIFKKNQVHHSLRWKMLMCSYTHYWNVMSQSHIHSMTVYQLSWRCFFSFHYFLSFNKTISCKSDTSSLLQRNKSEQDGNACHQYCSSLSLTHANNGLYARKNLPRFYFCPFCLCCQQTVLSLGAFQCLKLSF